MKVVMTHESSETNEVKSGHYHVLNDAETASLCGSLNEESQFAAAIAAELSQDAAERRGLTMCGRCAYIADQQLVASPAHDD